MDVQDPILSRMQSLIVEWDAKSDPKSLFLNCYMMMTSNMLAAISRNEFIDSAWVDRLLHHFAEYYFDALETYEQNHTSTPIVWHVAHEAAYEDNITPLQKILLGVNAHINHDLVFVLVDLLGSEWGNLSLSQREDRYNDLRHVNQVIANTIDAVQDQLIEPVMPFMELLDDLLGPIDEYIVSRLIAYWRDVVWENAVHMMETEGPEQRIEMSDRLIHNALRTAGRICPGSKFQKYEHI